MFAVSPLPVNSQGFLGGGIVVKCIFILVIKIIQACCTEYEKVHERTKKDMKKSLYCFEEQYWKQIKLIPIFFLLTARIA